MDESSKLLLTIAIPTVTILVGILINNRQLDQLSRNVDSRIAALEQHMDSQIASVRNEIVALRNEMIARIERVEGVLDARLKQVEEMLKLR